MDSYDDRNYDDIFQTKIQMDMMTKDTDILRTTLLDISIHIPIHLK